MAEQTYLDDNGNSIAAAPSSVSTSTYLDETGNPTAPPVLPKATQNRYSAPGQGIQEYTKGSTDEQQFLQRFPAAKVVSSYERDLLPNEEINTEAPEVRSARETMEAKKSLGTAAAIPGATLGGIAAAPVVGTGLLATSLTTGIGAGASSLAARSMVGEKGPTVEDVKASGKTAAEAAAATLTTGAALRVIPKVAPFLRNVFQGYDPTDLHEAITDAARMASPEVKTGGSVRNVLESASENTLAKSKELYAQVDQVTGGKWSANEQALRNVTEKLRDATGTLTDEAELDLLAKKMRYEWQQNALLDKMSEHGVPQETIDMAKSSYKKAMALLDTDAAVKASTVPGTETDPSIPGKEITNPQKLLTRITKLFDSGRLQDALSDNGSVKLLAETKAAALQKDAVKLHRIIAKWGAEVIGGAGALYGLYREIDPFAKFGGKSH